MLARCASRTNIVRVVSPSSVQNGAVATDELTWTVFAASSEVATGADTVGVASTLYVAGTGTSLAR